MLECDDPTRRIDLLTSKNAQKCYELGLMFVQLTDRSVPFIRAVTSDQVMSCLMSNFFTIQDLITLDDHDAQKIEALTSISAQIFYKGNHFSFAELKDRSTNFLEVLTSNQVMSCLRGNFVKIEALKSFRDDDAQKIEALTSKNAQTCYKLGLTLAQLTDRSVHFIRAVTSDQVISCLMGNFVKIEDLKSFGDDDAQKIEALTSQQAEIFYEKKLFSFAELKDRSAEYIEAATSFEVLGCLRRNFFLIEDLKILGDDDAPKIKALTSKNAQQYYELGLKFTQLAIHSLPFIEAIIRSFEVRQCLQENLVAPEDLMSFGDDKNKLQALTSFGAQECYKNNTFSFAELRLRSPSFIEAITGDKVRNCLKQGLVEKEDLMKFGYREVDKIDKLTNERAQQCYQSRVFSFTELSRYSEDDIEKLTSQEALSRYKDGFSAKNFMKENSIEIISPKAEIKLQNGDSLAKANTRARRGLQPRPYVC